MTNIAYNEQKKKSLEIRYKRGVLYLHLLYRSTFIHLKAQVNGPLESGEQTRVLRENP